MGVDTPKPENELERIINLSELDLDYSDLRRYLSDLTILAARITGSKISLVNLIDSFTQWSVAGHGMDADQMPREESVCNYTILEKDFFEVRDLSSDNRFMDKEYVTSDQKLRYYLGIPLETTEGINVGALCVLDNELITVDPEKRELLKLVADEVVSRLKFLSTLKNLKGQVHDLTENQKKISHDIRGPIGGIVGIAEMIEQDVKENRFEDILELISIVKKGGESVLELTEQIMGDSTASKKPGENQFTAESFAQKLRELYQPQAQPKSIALEVSVLDHNDQIYFSKSRLIQIAGNLISNSIKFTNKGGKVEVIIDIKRDQNAQRTLVLDVIDTGIGISESKIKEILSGAAQSTTGTKGESGFGYGLSLVKHLVDKANGSIRLESTPDSGTTFQITLPI